MKVIRRIAHEAIAIVYAKSYKTFSEGMPNAFEFQRQKLELFNNGSRDYAQFTKQHKISDYSDYQAQMEELKRTSKIRFHPTSGSTHKRKWIPYTEALKTEFDNAISPWLGDLYRSYPKIKKGSHYWSLSWLPNELRKECTSNDVEIMPAWKKFLLNQTMSVPNQVQYLNNSHESAISSITYLCSQEELSLISVWSPTFLISFLELLSNNKHEIVNYLKTGKWIYNLACPINHKQAEKIEKTSNIYDPAFLQELWPNLALISAWDSGSSTHWSQKLKILFPKVPFQGKGLLTTEAVITIPFHHQQILAYQSHFYEFKDNSNGLVLPSWELQKGMNVSPIVTTGSGFYRYQIPDSLKVEDFYNGVPVMRFNGRLRDIDLVGEKMSPELASSCFDIVMNNDTSLIPISLLAIRGNQKRSKYVLLTEGQIKNDFSQKIENKLIEHYHYSLARQLGQLDPIRVIIHRDAREIYQKIFENRGMISGEIKIETLTMIDESEFPQELLS